MVNADISSKTARELRRLSGELPMAPPVAEGVPSGAAEDDDEIEEVKRLDEDHDDVEEVKRVDLDEDEDEDDLDESEFEDEGLDPEEFCRKEKAKEGSEGRIVGMATVHIGLMCFGLSLCVIGLLLRSSIIRCHYAGTCALREYGLALSEVWGWSACDLVVFALVALNCQAHALVLAGASTGNLIAFFCLTAKPGADMRVVSDAFALAVPLFSAQAGAFFTMPEPLKRGQHDLAR